VDKFEPAKEQLMKREVGLWIDHHKTVMVTIVNEKEEIREVRSNVEKSLRRPSAIKVEDLEVGGVSKPEDVSDRRFGNRLGEYYDGVVSLLRNADLIWIFGPGEAKNELKKHLERANLGARISSVETVDKMTDRQIADKVRLRFE
jgi:hypothetical protein